MGAGSELTAGTGKSAFYAKVIRCFYAKITWVQSYALMDRTSYLNFHMKSSHGLGYRIPGITCNKDESECVCVNKQLSIKTCIICLYESKRFNAEVECATEYAPEIALVYIEHEPYWLDM